MTQLFCLRYNAGLRRAGVTEAHLLDCSRSRGADRYAPRSMPRQLERLPDPLPHKAPRRRRAPPRSAGEAVRALQVDDRVGWGRVDEQAQLRAALAVFGQEPNTNAAGKQRAARMVVDVQHYARACYRLDLTDAQARVVLDRVGWLVYDAMDWIDRLIAAAARDLAD
jgi:hypothetical protein